MVGRIPIRCSWTVRKLIERRQMAASLKRFSMRSFTMRTTIRALLIVVVLVVGGYFLLAFWPGSYWRTADHERAPTGTTGVIDTEKARERGAELGERAAVATEKVRETAYEAAVTAKIKAKMALDDYVRARSIDVS